MRLTNQQIQTNLYMIESRLKSDRKSPEEWQTIRLALGQCMREADKRILEASGHTKKES